MAVLPLALLLANEEVQIEGSAGWAANLPTWRIEDGWLLDLFWGGRPMTGYHVYIFSFVALFFHFPFAFCWRWSWRAEARALASIALFWVAEDFLWFLLNPAFGWTRFADSPRKLTLLSRGSTAISRTLRDVGATSSVLFSTSMP